MCTQRNVDHLQPPHQFEWILCSFYISLFVRVYIFLSLAWLIEALILFKWTLVQTLLLFFSLHKTLGLTKHWRWFCVIIYKFENKLENWVLLFIFLHEEKNANEKKTHGIKVPPKLTRSEYIDIRRNFRTRIIVTCAYN